jgi:hypothetical protein
LPALFDRSDTDFAGFKQADQNCSRPIWNLGAAPFASCYGMDVTKMGKLGQGDAELIQDAP